MKRLRNDAARKRWIASMKPCGAVIVDDGAATALGGGRSLLPVGVTSAVGDFGRGDPVAILDARGVTLGHGLTRYTSDEARLITGRHSWEMEEALGYPGRAVLIHRDDMAL